jgi:ParB-like chromosome segregation protein Spo0J
MKPQNTERNECIHQLHAKGKSQKQIAEALGLSEGTVAGVLSKNREKDRERKRQLRARKQAKPEDASASSEATAPEVPLATDPPARPTVTIGQRTFTILFPELLRPLTEHERQDLKDSIQENGVQMPVVVDEHDGVIDGGNRLILAAELGLTHVPLTVRGNLSEALKVELALTLNGDRRHLTPAQRKELLAQRKQRIAEARARGESIRTIAEKEGIDPRQVQRDLGSSGVDMSTPEATAPLKRVTGKDGKRYRAKKKRNPRREEQPAAAPVETGAETSQAAEASASQQQGELPFAEGSTHSTPSPYPQAQATAAPLPHDRLAALRDARARLDQVLADPPADALDERVVDALEAIGQEQAALDQLHHELFGHLVGVPVKESA